MTADPQPLRNDPRSVMRAGSIRDIVDAATMSTFPYSCIGTLRAVRNGESYTDANSQLAGSGVLVGPYHMLTATHIFNTRPMSEWNHYFLPAYHAGVGGPRVDTGNRPSAWLTGRFVSGNAALGHEGAVDFSGGGGWFDWMDNVNGWDFTICELNRRLGDDWGWMGVIWNSGQSFYEGRRWITVGYPLSTQEGRVPSRVRDLEITDVDKDDYNSREIESERRLTVGWSGGPLFAEINGEWRVAGVLSGHDADGVDLDGVRVFAGGPRLGDVHRTAFERWAKYDWVPDTEDMTRTFGYSQPKGAVAACSWELGRLDLFWRDGNDHLKHAWYPYDGNWSWEQDLTADFGYAPIASAPAACSFEPGRLDVFWRDANNHLKHAWYPFGDNWSWEQDLTADFGYGSIASAPAACSWGPGRLDVFWMRDDPQHLMHAWYPHDPDWSWPQDVTAQFGYQNLASGPAACSWEAGRLDVFWKGPRNHLMHAWYPYGEDWSFEQDLSAQFGYGDAVSSPAACSWEPGRMDVFWQGSNKQLRHAWYPYGEDWSFEQNMTTTFRRYGNIDSAPAACSWGPNRVDVFWTGINGHLQHTWYGADV
jgi:hypothetical protein